MFSGIFSGNKMGSLTRNGLNFSNRCQKANDSLGQISKLPYFTVKQQMPVWVEF